MIIISIQLTSLNTLFYLALTTFLFTFWIFLHDNHTIKKVEYYAVAGPHFPPVHYFNLRFYFIVCIVWSLTLHNRMFMLSTSSLVARWIDFHLFRSVITHSIATPSVHASFRPDISPTVLSNTVSPSYITSQWCARLVFSNSTSAHEVGLSPTGFLSSMTYFKFIDNYLEQSFINRKYHLPVNITYKRLPVA